MLFDSRKSDDDPITPATLGLAAAGHAVLFLALMIAGCVADKPMEVIPIDMTVVPPWAEQTDDPDPDPNPPPPDPPKETPKPKVEEPEPPPKIDEKLDAVVKTPEKPKKKEFKKSEKLVNPKELEKNKPKAPAFNKSRKIVNPPKNVVKYGKATAHDKPLSAEEFRKAMAAGATIGARNQLAPNEESRCLGLISRRVRECWQAPAFSDNVRAVLIEMRFGPGGRVTYARRLASSGDAQVDASIDDALRHVGYVAGLSAEFLGKYGDGVRFNMEVVK